MFPTYFLHDDGYGTNGRRKLIANGGTLDLCDAHVHDFDNAGVNGRLNDERNVV